MRHMVVIVPELTGYASIQHVAVSLPLVPQLLDGKKYMEAKDLPRLHGTELRRARAPCLRKSPNTPSAICLILLPR